jgi:hypothetical protein
VIAFTCNNLSDFGLPLSTVGSEEFRRFVNAQTQSGVVLPPEPLLGCAALLTNNSGQRVLGVTEIWKITHADGRTGTATLTPLASSLSIDPITGRETIPDWQTSRVIIPGSKRLLTVNSNYGDNSDVLGAAPVRPKNSCHLSFGGLLGVEDIPDVVHIHLQLDSVFLENGLCVGPDEAGTFESLTAGLELRLRLARRVKRDLDSGILAHCAY